MARKVRRDDTMAFHELRKDSQPLERVLARSMEQNDGWAFAASQNGGVNTGKYQVRLLDGETCEQKFTDA
jgi:hypothetical protein